MSQQQTGTISNLYQSEPALLQRLVLAGQIGDGEEIDAITDELAERGLVRPRTAVCGVKFIKFAAIIGARQ